MTSFCLSFLKLSSAAQEKKENISTWNLLHTDEAAQLLVFRIKEKQEGILFRLLFPQKRNRNDRSNSKLRHYITSRWRIQKHE